MSVSTFLAIVLLAVTPLISRCIVQASQRERRMKDDHGVSDYLQDIHSVESGTSKELALHLLEGSHHLLGRPSKRHLLVRATNNGSNSDSDQGYNEGNDNCTNPRYPPQKYQSSCDFVHAECAKKAELIDYMAFVVCDLTSVQVSTILL